MKKGLLGRRQSVGVGFFKFMVSSDPVYAGILFRLVLSLGLGSGFGLARHKHYMKKAFVDGDDPVTGCQERYQCCRVNITASVLGKVYK